MAETPQPFRPQDSGLSASFQQLVEGVLASVQEDLHLRDLLDGMWYESRIDTRSLPQPDHVLDLMKSKPVEAALDKQLREVQDGPVRDMLRLALHLGVRACKPGPDPGDPIYQVTAELDRIKMQARSTVSLCFSCSPRFTLPVVR